MEINQLKKVIDSAFASNDEAEVNAACLLRLTHPAKNLGEYGQEAKTLLIKIGDLLEL